MQEDFLQRPLAGIIIKNTLYNLITQGVLLLITVLGLRVIVAGITGEQFGLLSLLWLFIGYFTLLDFGISRAITKFLSESIALRNDERSGEVAWTSIYLCSMLGVVLGLVLYCLSPILVSDVLKVGAPLQHEAIYSFRISAFCLPFVLLYGAIRGIMMAAQKFLLANALQGLIGILQWGGAVILVIRGTSLAEIILLTLCIRAAVAVLSLVILPRTINGIGRYYNKWTLIVSKELLRYGSWVTVTQVISPVIVYVDRFFIGILISLTAVGYYAVPQETVTRLLTIPMSLTLTLFPALSGKQAVTSATELRLIYARSLKFLFIAMLPIVILMVGFAADILRVWVGNDMAVHSSLVFQILGIGLLFCSVAQIPLTVLHAAGRPDVTAKIALIELPIACVLNYVLIKHYGLIGASFAWTSRVILDAIILHWTTQKYAYPVQHKQKVPIQWNLLVLVFCSLVVLLFLATVIHTESVKILFGFLFCCFYCAYLWLYGLTFEEREFVLSMRTKMFVR